MDIAEGVSGLIKYPFQKYIEYISLMEHYDVSKVEEDLYLIGFYVPDLKEYVDYYKDEYNGVQHLDVPQLMIERRARGIFKKRKYKNSSIITIAKAVGFGELIDGSNYYIRYILLHPRIRQMVNELGMKSIDMSIIIDILKNWGNLLIPREQLILYYKYFWDFLSMTVDDWYAFLETVSDLELRDRYVDILSNDSSYVLGEYDYTEDINIDQVQKYTLKQIYLRFKRLIDVGEDDDKIIRYANLLKSLLADEKDRNGEVNNDLRAVMTLIGDAEIEYKDMQEIFNVEGSDKKAITSGGDDPLDTQELDLTPVKLPEE